MKVIEGISCSDKNRDIDGRIVECSRTLLWYIIYGDRVREIYYLRDKLNLFSFIFLLDVTKLCSK